MRKVIIAEDESGALKLLRRVVEGAGCAAIACSDGERAWQVLQDNPDVFAIVTDMQMPGLSGWDLLARMREDSQIAHVPVIVVSGAVKPNEISELLKAGATYFLPKPLNATILKDYLTRLKMSDNGSAPQKELHANR
jgi:CheY-like chemotaxis protein